MRISLFAIAVLAAATTPAHALLLIDDFDDEPQPFIVTATSPTTFTTNVPAPAEMFDFGNGTAGSNTDDMIGDSRKLNGTTVNPGTTAPGDLVIKTESDFVGNTFLSISNDDGVQGSASLTYDNLGGINLTSAGHTILMDVISIDTGVSVEIIVNATSTSNSVFFAGPGLLSVAFADFSDPSAFTSVESIQLQFEGSEPAWDGSIDAIRVVPNVATALLFGFGVVVMGVLRRRVQR